MAFKVKKIDDEAVKRQLQSGVYDNVPKASMGGTNVNAQKLADFKNYLKTDQGQTNFQNQLANSSYVQGNQAKLNKSEQQVAPGTPVTAQGIQGGQSNAQSYIDQLNNARLQQTLASLDKSRAASISNLEAEKAGIQPKYYDQRNQTAAGSQQQARNFAEFMAARGGTSAGANAQAELSRQGALQGNLGSLGRQEAQAYTDIGRRTTDVENAYQFDRYGAEAGIEGDRMQALLTDYYSAQERGDKLAQQAIMNEMNKAQLTGQYQGVPTLAGQQLDWNMNPNNPANQSQIINNEIQQLKLQNLPQELKLGLEALEQDIKTGQLNQQQAELKLKELQDPNSITNQANRLGLEASRLGNEELRKRIDQIGKVPALSSYEKQIQEMKLEAMKMEVEQMKTPKGATADAFIDDINKRFLADEQGFDDQGYATGPTGKKIVSEPTQLETYILSLGLSDAEAEKLYRYYGLNWGN